MDKELQAVLDRFIEEFTSDPLIKQYLLVKEEIERSERIRKRKEELNSAKKDLALSLGKENYEEKKSVYLSLQKEWDEDPLIVNYNVLKEEVDAVVRELKRELDLRKK